MRTLFALLVLAVAAVFAMNYWHIAPPFSQSRSSESQSDRMRERGAELGARAGEAVDKVGEAFSDAALTAKIRSKMALDDTLKPLAVNVDTDDGVVTLRGRVASEPQHERALQLARETQGVKEVKDQLQVGR